MDIDYVMQKQVVEETKKPMLAYVSKPPHKTWWLLLAFHETNKPTKLLGDLAVAGWAESNFPAAPPFNGVSTINLNSPGTDLFQDWKPKERESALKKCRQVLDRHKVGAVPYYKLTMQDCL